MNRDSLYREIADYFSRLVASVSARSALNLYDINIAAEDFYRDLLNLIYGSKLRNLNSGKKNVKAIDLADEGSKWAVQVTSEVALAKIKETAKKFEEDGSHTSFKKLTIIIMREKSKYRGLPTPNGYELAVTDYTDVLKDVRDLDLEGLKKVHALLEGEFRQAKDKSVRDAEIIEKFSANASRFISSVAEKIARELPAEEEDMGLDDHQLREKFKKMKCSATYRAGFDRNAAFFPNVNEVVDTDSVEGGAATVRAIIGAIKNIYAQLVDQLPNGDKIHSAIAAALIRNNFSPEECVATEVFIYYTVNECGIFNEEK